MFLLRLIHLKNLKPKNNTRKEGQELNNEEKDNIKTNITPQIINKETINQIKNISQEKKIKLEKQTDNKFVKEVFIKSFNDLVDLCTIKKEMELKYELEKNVNLVKFENGRIEISFNDNLNKDFVKNLSKKLLEWTNQRWIISFSKDQGDISIRDMAKNKQKQLIKDLKKTELYKTVLEYFPDADLIDVKLLPEDQDK